MFDEGPAAGNRGEDHQPGGPGRRQQQRTRTQQLVQQLLSDAPSSGGYTRGMGSVRRKRSDKTLQQQQHQQHRPEDREGRQQQFSRNRSSSFSHASLVCRPRMVTTFSAEGGELETSSTTITYQFFDDEGGKEQQQQQQHLVGFDLKAETDKLRDRTEKLFDSEKEFVI